MKNWNFTRKYTDHKTINSNNYVKFEVNWQRGSQFTARHRKNCLKKIALKSRTIWWIKSHNSGMKIRNFTIKYTDRKTINSNKSDIWSELAKGFSIYNVTYEKSSTIWWIKSHNSGMKNWYFTKKYTDRRTINSNNCAKFEVNWSRGSQFTARHTKNRLQFDE
jgi:hypothetical protein